MLYRIRSFKVVRCYSYIHTLSMKLDAKALRYMSSEEFRVLTAVRFVCDIAFLVFLWIGF